MLPGVARAQTTPAAGQAKPRALCFIPNDAAHCRRFVVLEAGLSVRQHGFPEIVRTPQGYPDRNALGGSVNWSLGGMQNVSRDYAVGAVVSHGFNGFDGARTTTEIRALRWLPNRWTLEGDAGVLHISNTYGGATGAIAGTALTYRDLVGVTATVETVDQRRRQSAVFLGVRTGSWVAPIVTAAGFGLLLWAFSRADWD
jgi:hypothetical protein